MGTWQAVTLDTYDVFAPPVLLETEVASLLLIAFHLQDPAAQRVRRLCKGAR